MIKPVKYLFDWLKRSSQHPWFPVLLGSLAYLGTLFESIPITILLSVSIAMNFRRWKSLYLTSVFGSALGALTLAFFIHHWGLPWISSHYPNVLNSSGWVSAERWVQSYGVFALPLVAALPIAQTPILIVCGLMKMPIALVFVSFFVGKLVKYGVVVYSVQRSARLLTPGSEQMLSADERIHRI